MRRARTGALSVAEELPMSIEKWDAIVVGAGQAGPALAVGLTDDGQPKAQRATLEQ
mgnify:CR=1 FL=1